MYIYFFIILLISLFYVLFKWRNSSRNNNIKNFKNKFINKDAKIEKIFLRDNERIIRDPNINLNIGIYEKEEDLKIKTNIHRARLAKYKKSKLNGEFIYKDFKGNVYKIINEKKEYI